MPSTAGLPKAVLAVCVGIAAVVGGLALGSLGYSQYGHCGSLEISVSEVPAEEVENPDEYTPFESLTADQQAAFERARETGEAYLSNRSGFPNIAYQNSYYTAFGPTVVCDFNPTTVMGLGGAISLLGLVILGWIARKGFRTVSTDGP